MRPWDKRKGESDKAFGGLEVYLDASKFERSDSDIAKLCGVEPSTIYRWAKEHDWAERARAWDSAILQAKHDIILEHQSDRYLKRYEDRLRVEEKISEKLEDLVDELIDIAENALAANHRVAAIKEAVRLSHIDDLDLTKQVTKQHGADALALIISEDMQKLTDEEAATQRALLKKMRGGSE